MSRGYEEAHKITEEMRARNGHVPKTFTGNELRAKEFPPVRWAVEGILPAGATLFGGREKMGKSWLAFGLCIAVATGGHALGKVPVEQGEALYLSLEDYERRLQKRLRRLARDDTDLSGLHYATEWEPADRGGVEDLDAWLTAHPSCRLVVVDTLKRIRPRASGKRNMYDEDYEAVQPFVPLASKHNAAVVLIHHLNQQSDPHDPLDAFSGSTGLTAAAEGFLLLTRKRGEADAFFMADGKDITEPQDLALGWDAETCAWTIQGDAANYRMHKERREIVELLEREDAPLGPKQVADILGRDYGAVRLMMKRMADAGELKREGYGKYTVAQGVSNSANTSNTSTSGSGVTGVNTVTPPLYEQGECSLTELRIIEALKDTRGGPWRAMQTYREKPSEERFGYLVNALLTYYREKPGELPKARRQREAEAVRETLGAALSEEEA